MKNTISILVIVLNVLFLSSCSEGESKKTDSKITYPDDSIVILEGKKIAEGSFKVLKGELVNAISLGGPLAGVQVCSGKAQNITDSLSKVYGVAIKRTSTKNRNPKNVATDLEKSVLTQWESEIAQSTQISPKVIHVDNGDVQFMAPIKMQQLCLACHGDHEFMADGLREEIEKNYPNDDAHGYKEGELRGSWSITFPKGYFKKLKE